MVCEPWEGVGLCFAMHTLSQMELLLKSSGSSQKHLWSPVTEWFAIPLYMKRSVFWVKEALDVNSSGSWTDPVTQGSAIRDVFVENREVNRTSPPAACGGGGW